jgi:hypothetical protein
MFAEPEEVSKFKQGQRIGVNCTGDKKLVSCSGGFATIISCPKECIELKKLNPLKFDNYVNAIKQVENEGRLNYAKKIPKSVIKTLAKKHPNWLPAFVNRAIDTKYLSEYELMTNYYLQYTSQTKEEVSIVYYFQDINKLIEGIVSWAFLNTNTGELIYDKLAPYKAFSDGYFKEPCLFTAGAKLNKIIAYGFDLGTSDATGCCGPFDLTNLKLKGPQPVDISELIENTSFFYDAFASTCGHSIDPITGRYNPKFYKIDGPANIRAGPNESSDLVGVCANNSLALKIGFQLTWYRIYCDGHYGWTSPNNIREK